jgi:hypothetical protein
MNHAAGPIQAAGAYAATGPLMLVRCRRNDGVKGRTESRWRSSDHRRHTVFSSTSCTARIDCSTTTARPCAAPAEVCASYPLPQKFAGLLRRPQIESTGNFGKAVSAVPVHVFGAHDRAPRQCCTRRRCALATDRRTIVLSPRDRRWLTYSFSARTQARRFQRVCGASGFCSRVFRACLFRCSARRAVKRIRGTRRMHG